MNILVGDIGGTFSRLMLFDVQKENHIILAEKTYQNHDFSSLTGVIKYFFSEHNFEAAVYSSCLAVAGPVIQGEVSVTNLPWNVTEKELGVLLNTPRVKLINDFISVAYGLTSLNPDDIVVLQKGKMSIEEIDKPTIAVIGAGTGLGATHLGYLDNHYHAFPSEAGHAGFAPETRQQTALLAWLQKKYNHVSLEMILSGRGLATIYEFLHETEKLKESEEVKKALRNKEPAKVISEYGIKGMDKLCERTLECFVDIYGGAAGNIALHYFPLNEVYIAGGIAVKIKNKMIEPRFIHAFNSKGLMSDNMKNISVKLVLNDKVGVYGALGYIQSVYSSNSV